MESTVPEWPVSTATWGVLTNGVAYYSLKGLHSIQRGLEKALEYHQNDPEHLLRALSVARCSCPGPVVCLRQRC